MWETYPFSGSDGELMVRGLSEVKDTELLVAQRAAVDAIAMEDAGVCRQA
jgi:hypothetical protein